MLLLVFDVHLQLSKQEALVREILAKRLLGFRYFILLGERQQTQGAQFLVWRGGRTMGLYQTVFFRLLYEEFNYLTRHISTFPPS